MMNWWKNKWFYVALAGGIAVLVLFLGLRYYHIYYKENVKTADVVIQIYKNATLQEVMEQIEGKEALVNLSSFKKAARSMHYGEHIRSGNYELSMSMGNKAILRTLSQGLQKPVDIQFNNLRTLEQLAGVLSKQIMLDSVTLIQTFRDTVWQDSLGFTQETAMAFFIPNTYEVWWNCTPERLMRTFATAYHAYWTEARIKQAADRKLTPIQVSILASIIEEESNRKEEWPVIAGLYLNRIKKRMYLQACPTVKFALNDFTIQRVLKEYTEVDSPYNTYIHFGLPPGPIRIPSIAALNAVINAQSHKYLYMCAKDDFSGGHYFSSTLSEHNRYADRYHRALNKRRIMH